MSSASLDAATFVEPPARFRPMPFWGLNDELTDHELRRQIAAMPEGGWGGFFVHPRYGLVTPYLGPEYMERMRTIRDEARRHGLDMWLYDEHPFPAGAAGGLVGAERKEHRHRVLAMNLHNRLTEIEEAVAYYAVDTDARGVPSAFERIAEPAAYRGRARQFLHFYEWEMPVAPTCLPAHANDFIHGFPYADLLNPAAVRRFVELTYDGYAEALGGPLAESVRGAFSDIPVYQWHYASPRPSVPWTPALPERFRERFGYDLAERLPGLFFDTPDGSHAEVRHDYWWLVSDLFVEAYTAQLADWCREHGIAYTAHYWGEETLHWQIAWTGDVMHHFTLQDVVANDHILRNIDDPLGIKQAATVAEQLGKERMITESYALSGHNLTFEERKWIGEWEYVLGSNFLVPYIPAYSMRGRRKRDEPPSQFVQQPYWAHEARLSDYFARLGWALTRGRRVVDTLLLQPLSTAAVLYKPGHEMPPAWHPTDDPFEAAGAELFEYSDAFRQCADDLLAAHHDFHVGNEHILESHAEVKGDRLVVGEASYAVVVVPPSVTWRASTARLLAELVEAGGRVIAVEPRPTMVDGKPAPEVLPSGVRVVPSPAAMAAAVGELHRPDVVVDGAPAVLYQHRVEADGAHVWFFVNTSTTEAATDVAVRLSGCTEAGALERWDLSTGDVEPLAGRIEDGDRRTLRLDFAPTQSHLLVFRPGAESGPARPAPAPEDARSVAVDGPWRLTLLGPNALVLDYCRARIDDGSWSEPIPTWRAHELVLRAGVGRRFELEFAFQVDVEPGEAYFTVESPERYDLRVNGHPFPAEPASTWWDPSLELFDIAAHLVPGRNVVHVGGQCGIDTEIEPGFVVGAFSSVGTGPFAIGQVPKAVKGFNLVEEGLPFFAGRVGLGQVVDLPEAAGPVVLRIDRLEAVAAVVRVNGREAGFLAWRPNELDITDFVRPGENEIEIELCTSLHNLLGPHHDRRGEARHFVIDKAWMDAVNWTDDYFFVPVGVTGVTLSIGGTE